MGILDSLIGALGAQNAGQPASPFGAGAGRPDPKAARVQMVIAMLMSGAASRGGGAGAGGAGGLSGLGGLAGMLGGGGGGGGAGAGPGAGGLGGLGAVLGGLGAAGGLGGLGALVERFQQNGLGEVANSWVSTGQNLPVSPDQVSQVFGRDTIGAMARQLGLSDVDVAGQLSEVLPEVVDRFTPEGRLPAPGEAPPADLAGLIGSLFGPAR
jgi:uncharacterized protein YidB (DUF937 family)